MAVPAETTGLIGGAIGRSLSPALHNAAFDYYNLPERYTLWPVSSGELAGRVAALRSSAFRGANVTIPHKAAVLHMVDAFGQAPDVRTLQAANTLVRRADGSLLALNTDVEGFLRALDTARFDPCDAAVVVCGAGGAARAVVWGLLQKGVCSLTLLNRSLERAHALLQALIPHAPAIGNTRVAALHPEDRTAEQAVRGADLLVNATPVGADGQACPIPGGWLHSGLFVSDLIYRPTPLLQAAARCGARTQDGLEMLVQQGALAFEAWTGLAAPVERMRSAAFETRARGT